MASASNVKSSSKGSVIGDSVPSGSGECGHRPERMEARNPGEVMIEASAKIYYKNIINPEITNIACNQSGTVINMDSVDSKANFCNA